MKGEGRKQPVLTLSIGSTGLIRINVFFSPFITTRTSFLQKEQKHKEGQRKLLHADIAIPARVTCWRKDLKSSDLDQGWMDG